MDGWMDGHSFGGLKASESLEVTSRCSLLLHLRLLGLLRAQKINQKSRGKYVGVTPQIVTPPTHTFRTLSL